jgi:hypothetical protein
MAEEKKVETIHTELPSYISNPSLDPEIAALLEEYSRKYPQLDEWLRVLNLSKEQYAQAMKNIKYPYPIPISQYSAF